MISLYLWAVVTSMIVESLSRAPSKLACGCLYSPIKDQESEDTEESSETEEEATSRGLSKSQQSRPPDYLRWVYLNAEESIDVDDSIITPPEEAARQGPSWAPDNLSSAMSVKESSDDSDSEEDAIATPSPTPTPPRQRVSPRSLVSRSVERLGWGVWNSPFQRYVQFSILGYFREPDLEPRRNIVAEKICEDPRGDDVSSPMKLQESPGDVISSPCAEESIDVDVPIITPPEEAGRPGPSWAPDNLSSAMSVDDENAEACTNYLNMRYRTLANVHTEGRTEGPILPWSQLLKPKPEPKPQKHVTFTPDTVSIL
ncbi:hypothetical protein J6590_094111 [Homalodisca vitripennis]|nr:hypothetical protein J6590_094111 [Homalodisca vitripennis]